METGPLDALDADLRTVSIPVGSRLHGVTVFDLRLPLPTVVTLIVRDGATTVPGHDTVLRVGDEPLLPETLDAQRSGPHPPDNAYHRHTVGIMNGHHPTTTRRPQ